MSCDLLGTPKLRVERKDSLTKLTLEKVVNQDTGYVERLGEAPINEFKTKNQKNYKHLVVQDFSNSLNKLQNTLVLDKNNLLKLGLARDGQVSRANKKKMEDIILENSKKKDLLSKVHNLDKKGLEN